MKKRKIIHLRVSPFIEGSSCCDCYICTLNPKTFIKERATWNREEVTCKKCLKQSEHKMYRQRRKYKVIEE
jgi:hypothetical protein